MSTTDSPSTSNSPSASNSPSTTLTSLLAEFDSVDSQLAAVASASEVVTLTQLASLLSPLPLALAALRLLPPPSDALLDALRSLLADLRRALEVSRRVATSPESAKLVEGVVRSISRCLAATVVSWEGDAEGRRGVEGVYREMVSARLEMPPGRPSRAKWGKGEVDWEDVVVRVKEGEGALEELWEMVEEGVGVEGERGRVVVQVLLSRLAVEEEVERIRVLGMLRRLAAAGEGNKEIMADFGALSTIAQSLANGIDEVREAIGLLASLANVAKVRQRIGRVPGCMKMIISVLNVDDSFASHDAEKLLHALSSNAQNVLLMAEAGYFQFVFPVLKEGSDTNKILMASAIARMDISDQMKADIGEGLIGPLVEMFTSGKLEAKLSSLSALRNLSTLLGNIPIMINSGIVNPLLQLLFSVTSVLLTLREPAAAVLACTAQSELILRHKDISQQILSLLSVSKPAIQQHLLHALNSIASHPNSSKSRVKMKRGGAIHLILPFLTSNVDEIRRAALKLLCTLSRGLGGDFAEKAGEAHLMVLVNIISTAASVEEKANAACILSNIPASDKKTTEILSRSNLLPVLASFISLDATAPTEETNSKLLESVAGLLVRFTAPSDKKLQRMCADLGMIPSLVRLLSCGSPRVWSGAANSFAQLSQNSISLSRSRASRWMCVPSSTEAFCKVHSYKCTVKSTFCLVKAGAVSPLIQILAGDEREADEAVLGALSTLLQDEILEGGSSVIEKASGVEALLKVAATGNSKAKEKAVWMLERILRSDISRQKYGDAVLLVLSDLEHDGNPMLSAMIAKIHSNVKVLQNMNVNLEP